MLRKFALWCFTFVVAASPCFADSQGSPTGGTSGTQSTLVGGIYQTSPSTLTNNQQTGLRVDSNGNLLTAAGAGTITTITNPVGIKGLDGATIATGFNPVPVLLAPSATQGVSTQSCTVACASTIVTGGHGVYGLSFSSTVTGWVLVYDATTCSANGTVTPKKAFAYTVANTTMGVSWNNAPMIDLTGSAICFSTTGPFTATASTTAFLSVDYK